jgi:hypothetical protein
MIFVLKLSLRLWGFGPVTKWITRRVQQVPATAPPSPAYVNDAERAVALASALYPGRAKCLEQSLVLYYLLRRGGIAVQYCQGVMAYPFEAHAWVEYAGEVLNDIPEHAASFARLPAPLP